MTSFTTTTTRDCRTNSESDHLFSSPFLYRTGQNNFNFISVNHSPSDQGENLCQFFILQPTILIRRGVTLPSNLLRRLILMDVVEYLYGTAGLFSPSISELEVIQNSFVQVFLIILPVSSSKSVLYQQDSPEDAGEVLLDTNTSLSVFSTNKTVRRMLEKFYWTLTPFQRMELCPSAASLFPKTVRYLLTLSVCRVATGKLSRLVCNHSNHGDYCFSISLRCAWRVTTDTSNLATKSKQPVFTIDGNSPSVYENGH